MENGSGYRELSLRVPGRGPRSTPQDRVGGDGQSRSGPRPWRSACLADAIVRQQRADRREGGPRGGKTDFDDRRQTGRIPPVKATYLWRRVRSPMRPLASHQGRCGVEVDPVDLPERRRVCTDQRTRGAAADWSPPHPRRRPTACA